MIARLRRRHATLVGAVALVVPLLVVLALAMRPTPPVMATAAQQPETDNWTPVDADGQVRALVESEMNREWLHLARDETFVSPDVLVYWSPEPLGADGALPASAVLLGALGNPGTQTLDLPTRDVAGVLTLYSLAHGSVVGSIPVSQIRRLDRGR